VIIVNFLKFYKIFLKRGLSYALKHSAYYVLIAFLQKIYQYKYAFLSSYSSFEFSITPLFHKAPSNYLVKYGKHSSLNKINSFLNHRFDLLGSGWKTISVERSHALANRKINYSNLKYSRILISKISKKYKYIDWHSDFKVGYHWNQALWNKKITIGMGNCNEDIKVPWELSRLYHFPLFGLIFISRKADKNLKIKALFEYENQFLDFKANNPPGYGVNWFSSMEVSIRAINLITSYNFFIKSNIFNTFFERNFSSYIYDHGKYIFNNLENRYEKPNNHYLSNLVGLLFISSSLPESKETNEWNYFAIKEFFLQINFQFNSEGTNNEASTAYHCLSTELVLLGIAIILGKGPINLEDKKLKALILTNFRSDKFLSKIRSMLNFIKVITKLNGNIIQIGDNDSGRILKLDQVYIKLEGSRVEYENNLNYNSLLVYGQYLFEEDFLGLSESKIINSPCYIFIQSLTKGNRIASVANPKNCIYPALRSAEINLVKKFQLQSCINKMNNLKSFNFKECISKNIRIHSFPIFGIYILRSSTIIISLRIFQHDEELIPGHQHEDQFGVEIHYKGKDLIADPGSFCYTSKPKLRFKYRSFISHFNALNDTIQNSHEVFGRIKQFPATVEFISESAIYARSIDGKFRTLIAIRNRSIEIYNNYRNLDEFQSIKYAINYGRRLN
jgi:hypothetical protein